MGGRNRWLRLSDNLPLTSLLMCLYCLLAQLWWIKFFLFPMGHGVNLRARPGTSRSTARKGGAIGVRVCVMVTCVSMQQIKHHFYCNAARSFLSNWLSPIYRPITEIRKDTKMSWKLRWKVAGGWVFFQLCDCIFQPFHRCRHVLHFPRAILLVIDRCRLQEFLLKH